MGTLAKTALNSAPLMNAVSGAAKGAMQAQAAGDAEEAADERDAKRIGQYNTNMAGRMTFFDRLATIDRRG